MNSELSRRQMLLMSALAVAAFSPVGKVLGADGAVAPVAASGVDAGSVAGYAEDGVYDQFAGKGFFIIRKDGKIVAQASVCTHKRGRLTPMQDGFLCKSHNATFSPDGKVLRPPAKKDLVRYAVRVDEDKHVIVDTSKRIERAGFSSPGAYVEASAA